MKVLGRIWESGWFSLKEHNLCALQPGLLVVLGAYRTLWQLPKVRPAVQMG